MRLKNGERGSNQVGMLIWWMFGRCWQCSYLKESKFIFVSSQKTTENITTQLWRVSCDTYNKIISTWTRLPSARSCCLILWFLLPFETETLALVHGLVVQVQNLRTMKSYFQLGMYELHVRLLFHSIGTLTWDIKRLPAKNLCHNLILEYFYVVR